MTGYFELFAVLCSICLERTMESVYFIILFCFFFFASLLLSSSFIVRSTYCEVYCTVVISLQDLLETIVFLFRISSINFYDAKIDQRINWRQTKKQPATITMNGDSDIIVNKKKKHVHSALFLFGIHTQQSINISNEHVNL